MCQSVGPIKARSSPRATLPSSLFVPLRSTKQHLPQRRSKQTTFTSLASCAVPFPASHRGASVKSAAVF